ncbi:hypothetical protein CSOJ01_09572 [Colletotrichum sojae]|uniref:Uncharacterized protein n=1 Tax=Colletotrichum sojae TaxID=2175907 RepID=A0A8H6MR95_9PEZI|nr:hypothetical protein CSOJ01_09572 [Colletotrichum sojae]
MPALRGGRGGGGGWNGRCIIRGSVGIARLPSNSLVHHTIVKMKWSIFDTLNKCAPVAGKIEVGSLLAHRSAAVARVLLAPYGIRRGSFWRPRASVDFLLVFPAHRPHDFATSAPVDQHPARQTITPAAVPSGYT